MTKPQLIALMAATLQAGRSAAEGFGEGSAIAVDVALAEKIWLKAVEEDK